MRAANRGSAMVTRDISVAYMKAVKALRSLANDEGLDVAERASAKVLSSRRKEAAKRDWKVSGRHPCIKAVEGKRCAGPCGSDCQPPGSDHATIIEHNGRLCYFYQPYGLGWGDLQALVNYCEERGLAASVDALTSWHFPGHTVGVLVYRKEANL